MEINKNKTASIRHLGAIDISTLQKKVNSLKINDWDTPEDFEANYNKRHNSVLNATKHMIFRFSNKQKKPFEYSNYSRWGSWEQCLLELIEEAAKAYGYRNGIATRVMLANLPPKSFIAPHTDGNKTGSIPHKIHIPILTNEDSFFYVDGEKFHLEEGKAYEVNNSAKHSVVNNGTTGRIHLIFEYLDYDVQTPTIQQQLDKI